MSIHRSLVPPAHYLLSRPLSPELLRVIDSLQLTAGHSVATAADWKPGEDVIIVPAVSDEDAHKRFPGFVAQKPYLRVMPQPTKS